MSVLVRPWLRRALLEYGQQETTFEKHLQGKYCQITRWLSSQDTHEVVWAEVSDSEVIVPVQFSPQSAQLFNDERKRRLSENTRWGVIVLQSFRLNFALVPTFGNQECLNLRVEVFQWEGSDGEACFGNPTDIFCDDAFATWRHEWNAGHRDDIPRILLTFPLPAKYVNKTLVSRHNSRSNSIPGPQPKNKTAPHSSEQDGQKSKDSVAGEEAIARLESQLWGKAPLSPFPKDVLFSLANNPSLSAAPVNENADPVPVPFSVLSSPRGPTAHEGSIVSRHIRDTEDWFTSSPMISQEADASTPEITLSPASQTVRPFRKPNTAHHHTPKQSDALRTTQNLPHSTVIAGPSFPIPRSTTSGQSVTSHPRHVALINNFDRVEDDGSSEDSVHSSSLPSPESLPELLAFRPGSQVLDPQNIGGRDNNTDEEEKFIAGWELTPQRPRAAVPVEAEWGALDSNVHDEEHAHVHDDDAFMGDPFSELDDPTRSSPPIARLGDSDSDEDGTDEDDRVDQDEIVTLSSQSLLAEEELHEEEVDRKVEHSPLGSHGSSLLPPPAQPRPFHARNRSPPSTEPPTPIYDVLSSIPSSERTVPVAREPVVYVPNSDPSSGSQSQPLSHEAHSQSMSLFQPQSQLPETPEINNHSMTLEEMQEAPSRALSPPHRKSPSDTSRVDSPCIRFPPDVKVEILSPPNTVNQPLDSLGSGHGESLPDDERGSGEANGDGIRVSSMNQEIEVDIMSAPIHDVGAIQVKPKPPTIGQHRSPPTAEQSNGPPVNRARNVLPIDPPAPIARNDPFRVTIDGALSAVSAKIPKDPTRGYSTKHHKLPRSSPISRLNHPKKPGPPVFGGFSAVRPAGTKKVFPLEFRSPSPMTDVFGPLASPPRPAAVSRITGAGRPSLFAAAKQKVSFYKSGPSNPISRDAATSPGTPATEASSSRQFVSSPLSVHVHKAERDKHAASLPSPSRIQGSIPNLVPMQKQMITPEARTSHPKNIVPALMHPESKRGTRTESDILSMPATTRSNRHTGTTVPHKLDFPQGGGAVAAEDKWPSGYGKRRREESPGIAENGRARKQLKISSNFPTHRRASPTNNSSVRAVVQAKPSLPLLVTRVGTPSASARSDSVPVIDFLQPSTRSKKRKHRTSTNSVGFSGPQFPSSPALIAGPSKPSVQHSRRQSASGPSLMPRASESNGTAPRSGPSPFNTNPHTASTASMDRKGKGREVPIAQDPRMAVASPDVRPARSIPEHDIKPLPSRMPHAHADLPHLSRFVSWADCRKIVKRVRDIRDAHSMS